MCGNPLFQHQTVSQKSHLLHKLQIRGSMKWAGFGWWCDKTYVFFKHSFIGGGDTCVTAHVSENNFVYPLDSQINPRLSGLPAGILIHQAISPSQDNGSSQWLWSIADISLRQNLTDSWSLSHLGEKKGRFRGRRLEWAGFRSSRPPPTPTAHRVSVAELYPWEQLNSLLCPQGYCQRHYRKFTHQENGKPACSTINYEGHQTGFRPWKIHGICLQVGHSEKEMPACA